MWQRHGAVPVDGSQAGGESGRLRSGPRVRVVVPRRWRLPGTRSVHADLERRIRRELRGLDVQPPLTVEGLCSALGDRRGRPIVLKAYPLPAPGPSGMWFETSELDLVLYQQHTSARHQDHIILHEVGHVLADHAGTTDFEEQWSRLIPAIGKETILRLFTRCGDYGAHEEQEAELVATILAEWASVVNRVSRWAVSDPAVRRINSVLSDRQGWL